ADIITVNVTASPQASFSVNNNCFGSPASFTNQTIVSPGTLSAVSWNFGDASSASLALNPTHNYTAANVYTVVMTATSVSGCTATVTKQLTVNPLPNVVISPST